LEEELLMPATNLWEDMGIGINTENGGGKPLDIHGSALVMAKLPARLSGGSVVDGRITRTEGMKMN
jgi:hypothetical protein